MSDNLPPLLKDVHDYFDGKFKEHGANYKGVDYGNPERQIICFDQLLKICRDPQQPFTINDYGCGYGLFVDYLAARAANFRYTGFDISQAMVDHAREKYAQQENCRFVSRAKDLSPADYTIASGIFNVRLKTTDEAWLNYILQTLDILWALSEKGMAFNILTKYSDADKMREYLYYADPCQLFDHCKRRFSRNVALLHDYEVYEFTILVRRT